MLYSVRFKMCLSLGLLVLLCLKPLDTQSTGLSVVNVQALNYPNNVIRVAEYESNGKINVELSEDVRDNQVEITCRTLPSNKGFTSVSFKKDTIPIGRRDGSVRFDVVSSGHIVEVHCSGQSVNGGSQFQTTTSVGKLGYIQVTKRPTVSVCSDVIVVPMNSGSSRTVEVLFSENTTHATDVNCSVLAPVKVNSFPMKLKFSATLAPAMTMKIKVTYELQTKGDPVIVACKANSTSTTPPANLQYTFDKSQGDTAIFTFQVLQATFVPASIMSLGRTTIGHTVSYLVLEASATNLTEFQCSLMEHDPNIKPVSLCSAPGGSQWTSLELTTVTVDLVTTNMTFEIGDLFKPLVIKVNGTSTQRDQKLLDVTCCRKNADAKDFVLATTISLWIDIFPTVQFKWTNVTEVNAATPYSRFDAQCPCDLGVARCDVGCCCDKDCTAVEIQTFPCIPGFFGGASKEALFEYGCQETYPRSENYLALLCVLTNNNPFLGMLYEFTSSPAEDSVQFGSLKEKAENSPYEYSENEGRLLNEEDASTSVYRDGVIVKTNAGYLRLPQGIAGGACARYAPVAFLRNSDTWCSGEFSESMCGETSPWSARDYLVSSSAHRFHCAPSSQVLGFDSRENSTEVPTNVAYFCTKDVSEFTTAVQHDWGSPEQGRSLFESAAKTEEEFGDESRCPFDDGVSKPEVPRFNASLDTCFNVVLKVQYYLYWRAAQIVQVRVKIILGDVQATGSLGKLFVFQRFSVKFIHLKDIDRSQLPFIEIRVTERSGNPGYEIGKIVLAKIEKNESVVLDFATKVNETTLGELGLWSSLSNGLCSGAKTSRVFFGVNAWSGCVVQLSLQDIANCSKLREAVLESQRRLVETSHVARRGNAVLNNSDDWLPLLRPPSPIPTQNISGNQTLGICENVPAAVHYELLVQQVGKYQGIAQTEIVGARIRYSLHSWTFHCINQNCKVCNVNTTNDTALCTQDVQSFVLTSSVVFIRSADSTHTCHQDTCTRELFYPLTTSYDGEVREMAIAYGLMLFALILAILAFTTSCLRSVRLWIAR